MVNPSRYVFQSTLPGWGATASLRIMLRICALLFQSTLPGWGATPPRWQWNPRPSNFNPRSPDGERLHVCHHCNDVARHFNPRSPDGERRCDLRHDMWIICISIHAPRMGSDLRYRCGMLKRFLFQSTLPGWGATSMVGFLSVRRWHFNPRSPDGERHITTATAAANNAFQSTLPGWGATPPTLRGDYGRYHFNPRSPDGERPSLSNHCSCVSRISIHAPRMGSDDKDANFCAILESFQSTLPGWGATATRLEEALK